MDNNAFKIRRDYILDSNVNYIKNIEKRFNAIIKRSIASSAKFRTPSLYSDDSIYNYTNKRLRIPDFELNKNDFESEKNIYGRSNTASNFDNRNKLFSINRNNLFVENDLQSNRNINNIPSDKINLRFNKEKDLKRNNLLNEEEIKNI